MKMKIRKAVLFVCAILILLLLCSCSVKIDFFGATYEITIHNDVAANIQVSINNGQSLEYIASGNQKTLSLKHGTQIVVHIAGNPSAKFAINDNAVNNYTFTLDGSGYTLYAEIGSVNIFSLRVTRVL